jgi:hypothetical protein
MGTSIYKNNQSFPFNKLCTLIEKALGYFSTWPPTATIILGNIGILEDGAFIHVGYFDKILEVGDIRKIVTPNSDVMYSLLGSVAINQEDEEKIRACSQNQLPELSSLQLNLDEQTH